MNIETLQTLLVEDEGAALRRLTNMAREHPNLQVVGTADSGRKAMQKIKTLRPELILLDIELKDITAFELLQEVEPIFQGQLIFITAYNTYAVQAFELAATDYLLKPFDKKRFDQAIGRAIKNRYKSDYRYLLNLLNEQHTPPKRIAIREGAEIHYFDPIQVVWIEADGYYCKIHRQDGQQQLLRLTLKEVNTFLPEQFLRINRSAIINTDHIAKEVNYLSRQYYYLTSGIKLRKSPRYDHSSLR